MIFPRNVSESKLVEKKNPRRQIGKGKFTTLRFKIIWCLKDTAVM